MKRAEELLQPGYSFGAPVECETRRGAQPASGSRLFAKGIVTRIGRDRSAGAVNRDAMPAKANE
jgi:hypothetical protein